MQAVLPELANARRLTPVTGGFAFANSGNEAGIACYQQLTLAPLVGSLLLHRHEPFGAGRDARRAPNELDRSESLGPRGATNSPPSAGGLGDHERPIVQPRTPQRTCEGSDRTTMQLRQRE